MYPFSVTFRGAMQNVQALQPTSSFYQQPQQPLQQTGFFQAQQASTGLQVVDSDKILQVSSSSLNFAYYLAITY